MGERKLPLWPGGQMLGVLPVRYIGWGNAQPGELFQGKIEDLPLNWQFFSAVNDNRAVRKGYRL